MTSAVAPNRASPSWTDHLPWSRGAWRNTTFVTAGVPVHALTVALMSLPWVGAPVALPKVLLATVLSLALPFAALWPLNVAQRSRFWGLLAVDVPAPPRGRRDLRAVLRSGTTWRALAYHALAGPLLALGGLLVVVMWATGFGLAGLYAYAWALPPYSPLYVPENQKFINVLTVCGVLLLIVTPTVAALVARLDVRAGLALLGPSRTEELERRVEDLAEKRAGVVDAADAERRRIERDLHDGVQQRLVSLAMNLGLARETLTDVPDDAMQVIAEAHSEAKEALTELRNVVRGLHPAVLDDRGLDAALSGIAARAPLPVRLRVDVPERPAPTVEAVAYFVASEALTNVAKHARASHAEVVLTREEDVLRMTITDDGIGGAEPSNGTGLTGLRQRVASVDGTFRITSPAGGPTVITVELPCAL
ncbi:sensor histidine kinase [Actinoallomurus rhizosphaericola]|uniref:sensor histidine kinase n=1 Tax=Actinoallomurus rhizosphaericola TaxID=2952536 RepID=UPI002093C876|nr:sensor histidine kinase [Actinoallomurus rhizosphaericola]MCO5994829.1 sensor histidine kinase [Actinoallomurus rhizosphaericola]